MHLLPSAPPPPPTSTLPSLPPSKCLTSLWREGAAGVSERIEELIRKSLRGKGGGGGGGSDGLGTCSARARAYEQWVLSRQLECCTCTHTFMRACASGLGGVTVPSDKESQLNELERGDVGGGGGGGGVHRGLDECRQRGGGGSFQTRSPEEKLEGC